MNTAPKAHGDNGFDLIRLGLALIVVYAHGRLLGGFPEDGTSGFIKHQTDPARVAVLGFFGISGFLISQSYCSAPRCLIFLKRRALRILPAFYLALFFSAFLAAPLLGHILHPGQDDWHFKPAVVFIERNAFLRIQAWTVGAETRGLPYDGSIDGALWSLFPEACCYLLVLGLGLSGALLRRRYEILGISGCLFLINFGGGLSTQAGVPLFPSFLALSGYTPFFLAFAVGASVHAFRESAELGWSGLVVTGLFCAAILKFGGWAIFGPVVFPLFVLHLAHSFRVRLSVDLSYGIYVLHFPCEQLLAAWNVQRHGFAAFFFSAALVTTLCALASWFLVELPALRHK